MGWGVVRSRRSVAIRHGRHLLPTRGKGEVRITCPAKSLRLRPGSLPAHLRYYPAHHCSFNESRPLHVRGIFGVLPAIDFDHKTRLMTCEIHDISAEPNLSAEMRSSYGQPVQVRPKLFLRH